MYFSSLLITSLALATVPMVLGYPGMGKQLAEIVAREDGAADAGDSTELLGDLVTLSDKELTPVGKDIKKLLQGKGNPESNDKYSKVPGKGTEQCKKDTCCIWKYIADDMQSLFAGRSGRCTKWARFAVRLGFHDAGTWSKTTAAQGLGGGADGSIVLGNELGRGENSGLAEIGEKMQKLYNKYNTNGYAVSMADLVQMGATVATVVCPLGPRIRSFVGRKDSSIPAPDGLLPNVSAPADELIALFRDKTIGPHGLVALVGAHTTSQQHFVDTSRSGDPQDSTPGVWDVLFYPQTTNKAPKRIFKFPSDVALAAHPETRDEWNEFAGKGGQSHWNEDFAREYIRLSLLGVNNINQLTECTKVLPPMIKSFKNPDQKKIDKWLDSITNKGKGKKIADDLDNGDVVVDDV